MKFLKEQFGFSLIEVILAIGILSVIGVISSNLLTRTYRTSSDADFLSRLKQNGAVASDILGEAIRMADSVVCYEPANNSKVIIIRNLIGKYVRYRFVEPGGYIAKKEDIVPRDLSTFCQEDINTSGEAPITDRDPSSGVSITNGKFNYVPGVGGKDTVTIKFDVGPPLNQSGQAVIVNIQTTVQVR
ncbi:prepilin-type N-terminal cleavage/methylation domain-containing protein [Candidatus Daviesbacteria bacterium]|nr:prepilin-type N-terminal cleavage/methylation domain-containing protein [Candidatus Daviesbacteria bacterium]